MCVGPICRAYTCTLYIHPFYKACYSVTIVGGDRTMHRMVSWWQRMLQMNRVTQASSLGLMVWCDLFDRWIVSCILHVHLFPRLTDCMGEFLSAQMLTPRRTIISYITWERERENPATPFRRRRFRAAEVNCFDELTLPRWLLSPALTVDLF